MLNDCIYPFQVNVLFWGWINFDYSILVPNIQKMGSNVAIWGAYIEFPWSLVAILPSSAQPLWQLPGNCHLAEPTGKMAEFCQQHYLPLG